MIKAILYDLDGVLVDACEWHYLAFNKALASLGCQEISYEDHISTYNGLPSKRKMEILIERGILTKDQAVCAWNLKQQYTKEAIQQLAIPDEQKILMHKTIAEQYPWMKIGCVTNSIGDTARMMLSFTGQLRFVDVLITNEDTIRSKPNPDQYIYAMNKLGVYPKETLIIEDSPKGIIAAETSHAHVRRTNNASELNATVVLQWIKEIS